MQQYIIYLATSPSGKQYVGLTKQSLKDRIQEHKHNSNKKALKYKFMNAIRKYGISNISFIVIDVVDNFEEAKASEIYYVEKYDTYYSGYNSTKGGGGIYGYKHTDEYKEYVSEQVKKRNLDLKNQGLKPLQYIQYSENEVVNKYGIKYIRDDSWNNKGDRKCLFECSCGKQFIAYFHIVKSKQKSCGCAAKGVNKTHGLTKTTEYMSWSKIKSECYNTSFDRYPKIGGIGIKVCDEWLNSFETFLSDMGNRPSSKFKLKRIDALKNFNKENCRWVELILKPKLKKEKLMVSYNNVVLSIDEWSLKYNIEVSILKKRIKRGWPLDKVFLQNVRIRQT